MDPATAQRHLANVERHIAEGRAGVLRQQEIIRRLESAGNRRSETASIARAPRHAALNARPLWGSLSPVQAPHDELNRGVISRSADFERWHSHSGRHSNSDPSTPSLHAITP